MQVRIYKDNIKDEDKGLAISILNTLRRGVFVIGNPGLGLKKTLVELENKRDSRVFNQTDWMTKDSALDSQIMMTKAGIEGEEKLCEYLSRLIKYDDELKGIVAFASLSYDQEKNTKEYIPDTDVLLVYGRNLLILDAKNIKTRTNKAYLINDGFIIENSGKELIGVNPSTHIWQKIMYNAGIPIDSIEGYVCIVNETETEIIRDEDWYYSQTRLIHVAELHDILKHWIKGKDNSIFLNILTEIAKAQIKEEKNFDLDIESIKKQFGI
jgi:hypothetical protein